MKRTKCADLDNKVQGFVEHKTQEKRKGEKKNDKAVEKPNGDFLIRTNIRWLSGLCFTAHNGPRNDVLTFLPQKQSANEP